MGWELFAGIFIPLLSQRVVPRDEEQIPMARRGDLFDCYWFSSFPSIFLEDCQHFQGEVLHPWLSLNKEPLLSSQDFPLQLRPAPTNSITPFPLCLALPSQPGGFCSSVVFAQGCRAKLLLCFGARVFIPFPSFLEQTQLSGGQQDFLLQVPVNQD